MRTPKKRLAKAAAITGEIEPSPLSLAVIRQFAHCSYIEKRVRIPDKTLYMN